MTREQMIEGLIAARTRARRAEDFVESDRIADMLLTEHGVVLKDGPEGTTWRFEHLSEAPIG